MHMVHNACSNKGIQVIAYLSREGIQNTFFSRLWQQTLNK